MRAKPMITSASTYPIPSAPPLKLTAYEYHRHDGSLDFIQIRNGEDPYSWAYIPRGTDPTEARRRAAFIICTCEAQHFLETHR